METLRREVKLRWVIIDRLGDHDHIAKWKNRCIYCGHRVGPNVIETRKRPWRIPFEIIGRYQAMKREVKM